MDVNISRSHNRPKLFPIFTLQVKNLQKDGGRKAFHTKHGASIFLLLMKFSLNITDDINYEVI